MESLAAVGQDHAIQVSWTPSSLGAEATEFWVLVDGRVERTEKSSLLMSGLRNGQEYEVLVYSANDAGRSQAAESVRATPANGTEGQVAGLIVKFAPGVPAAVGTQDVAGEASVNVDLQVAAEVSSDAVLVSMDEPVSLDEAKLIADQLEANPSVEWAEPDQFLFTSAEDSTTASDASSWNLAGQYGIGVEQADSMANAGAGSTVAVIDTGITAHPLLESRLAPGYDFVSAPEQLTAIRQATGTSVSFDADYQDPARFGSNGRDDNPADPGDWRESAPARNSTWHGTKMAGLIAAVAPGARIQPIRALSWRGGLLSDIAASITWASGGTVEGAPANATPAKVINMSFAVEAMCPVALQEAINGARERGSILVAAAGNANDDASKYAPGNCNGVITVGATTSAGLRANYSNYGSVVDISAPGGDNAAPVTSASNDGAQGPGDATSSGDFGTSISAAHVSAGAAILAGRSAGLTPDSAYRTLTGRDHVKSFASPTCDANPDYSCGAGILSLAQVQVACSPATSSYTTSGTTYQVATFTAIAAASCSWTPPAGITNFSYLVVGGGGGGGGPEGRYSFAGGGGGGGQVVEGSNLSITAGQPITVTVGQGGTGGVNTSPYAPTAGGQSKIQPSAGSPIVTAVGGGRGGSVAIDATGSIYSDSRYVPNGTVTGGGGAAQTESQSGASATYSGGNGSGDLTNSTLQVAGGGGGAGGPGLNATSNGTLAYGGNGGPGVLSSIDGTAKSYGGGGGGGKVTTNANGSSGKGGNNGTTSLDLRSGGDGNYASDGLPGVPNRGGGGGGGGGVGTGVNAVVGGDGADGVVVLSYVQPTLSLSVFGGVQPVNYAYSAGWTTAPKVQLVDTAGSAATTSGISVTATFSGSATIANATVSTVGGVANFSGMTFTGSSGTSGTLTFTASGYAPVTSNAFDVKSAQAALTVTSTSGTFGTPLTLTSSGGTTAGAVTYVVNSGGTASGCAISSGSLTSTNAGTCLVTATMLGNANYFDVSSGQTTITMGRQNQQALVVDSTSGTFNTPLILTSSGGSGTGAVTFTASDGTADNCTVTSGTLVSSSAGTCLVTATKAADNDYNAISSLATAVALGKASQAALTVTSTSGTYGTALILTTSGGSGVGLVSYSVSSVTATGCSVSGGALTVTTVGTCSVTAFKAADNNYNLAWSAATTVTIAKATQATLSMTSPSTALFGQTLTLASSGGTGAGAVSYGVVAGTCSLSGAVLTLGDAGSLCQVSASKQGTANYDPQTSATQTIVISKAAQTIAFTSAVPAYPVANGTYTPTMTSLSAVTGLSTGITPSLTASGTCTASGGVVTFTASGSCIITAAAAGPYTNFLAATSVTQVIAVGYLNQTIDFAQPSNKTFGASNFGLTATASSGLEVTFTLGSGTTGFGTASEACSVSTLGVVTIEAMGTCEAVASQAGDGQYAAASDVTRAFQIAATTSTAPTLTSASASSQAITVGFTVPTSNGGSTITAYQVVATPTGAGTAVTSTSCTTSPCTISGLENGTEYRVTVAAINSAGTGTASSASTALTPATAAFAVSDLSALPGDTNVTVSWTALTDAQRGGGTFTRYELSRRVTGTSSWTLVTSALTNQSDHSYVVSGLSNGTSYDFQVVAITSANSAEISGNTAQVVQYAATVPGAPQSPTVLAATTTTVQFSWMAPLSDGGAALTSPNYTVTVTGSTGAASVTCTPSSTGTQCTVGGLTNGALYTFAVQANNRIGASVAATATYAVPSSDANLTNVVLTGSAGIVPLTPTFATATVAYTATVDNAVSTVSVTPTTSAAGATVTVQGVSVTSGAASAAVPLAVGITAISIVVTASDPAYTKTYTVMVTRAAASGGGGSSVTPNVPPAPTVPVIPPTGVSSGDVPGAVLENGIARTDIVLHRTPSNTGWEVLAPDFTLTVNPQNPNGSADQLAANGALRVPQNGSVSLRGDGYAPGTQLFVFAIPRTSPLARSGNALDSVPTAIFLGSVPVSGTGSVSGAVRIPADMQVGDYVLQLNGVTTGDQLRSVNLLLQVYAPAPSARSSVTRAAFFRERSKALSHAGTRKLNAMIGKIPANAKNVTVNIVGVSVSLGTPQENIDLARDRALEVVDYLTKHGVRGAYSVSISTNFDVVEPRSRTSADAPVKTPGGKPLTTATIAFDIGTD